MWPEIYLVKSEKRRELVLSGSDISARIETYGLKADLYHLYTLKYLSIYETKLPLISVKISQLNNLQTLILHSNALTEVPREIYSLQNLKFLDLSRNKLQAIPKGLNSLEQLTTLNISYNALESIPTLKLKTSQLTTLNISSNALESFPKLKLTKLAILDVSNNKLVVFPDICYPEVSSLRDVKLNCNDIEILSPTISNLSSLKNFDISSNKIKVIPRQLAECRKLKDLNLKNNPISDRRLHKLISQCRTKQVLEYVQQHCLKIKDPSAKLEGANEIGEKLVVNSEPDLSNCFQLIVEHSGTSPFRIIKTDRVKTIRAHILGCIVTGLHFTDESLNKFIQMQTRLHSNICLKRKAATIATHDLKKLSPGDLIYTTQARDTLVITPQNANKPICGSALLSRMGREAEALRKEKRRKVYSGIHKYLHLVQGQPHFPCLLDNGLAGMKARSDGKRVKAKQRVISFPPITNADGTKLTVDTTSMFLEVTSSTSLTICKKVLDDLIKECYFLFKDSIKSLIIGQIKIIDPEGNLKAVYPAKNDLKFDQNLPINVQRNLRHK